VKPAGRVYLSASVLGLCFLAASPAGVAVGHGERGRGQAKASTDGRLRPGHLETIRVVGFPGRGLVEVAFFPTAICEDECAARSRRGGWTDARGKAKFRVRVPGTFIDQRNRSVYFRNGERIDLEVLWEGAGHSFAVVTAEPEPIIVRTHGSDHG
jgi:hypothetical protein